MPVDPKTLAEYEGKQVILTLITEDGANELEGKVEAASEAGLAFKEKGKRDVDLVMPEEIEEIALAPVKPKKLPQKKLKPVTESTARQHLLDRHGWARSEANELTDEEAFKLHDELDHADLGHKHVSEDDDESDDEAGDESDESGADEE